MNEIQKLTDGNRIHKWLKRHGIPMRKANYMLSGNYVHTKNSYVYVTILGKAIPQHRYLIEQFVGYKLPREWHVHHIDGDKANNALNNLYIFKSNSEHRAFHNRPKPIFSNVSQFLKER